MRNAMLLVSLFGFALMVFACGATQQQEVIGDGDGHVMLSFAFLSDDVDAPFKRALISDVERVEIEVQPAGITETAYGGSRAAGDAKANEVEGEVEEFYEDFEHGMVVPEGEQTFTAKAYDDSDNLIGQGSATATVIAQGSIDVRIVILDTTGSEDPFGMGPYITSLTADKDEAILDEDITLTVVAQDPDDDPLTYSWSSDCTGDTFDSPTAASTTWSKSTVGYCDITVTVSDGKYSDSASIAVSVFSSASEGTANIDGTYIPNPFIPIIIAETASEYWDNDCSVGDPYLYMTSGVRPNVNATCKEALPVSETVTFESIVTLGRSYIDPTFDLTTTCEGSISTLGSALNTGAVSSVIWSLGKRWQWTPDAADSGTLCVFTFRGTNAGLVDEAYMAIYVE